MTETEKKALALTNEVARERGRTEWMAIDRRKRHYDEALCRAIEQHEAFRQEVSDAVEAVFAGYHDAPIPWVVMRRKLEPFIIPKPDPLVEVFSEMFPNSGDKEGMGQVFRAALAARGLEIREKQ